MEKANALKDPDEQSEFKRSNPSSSGSIGGGAMNERKRIERDLNDFLKLIKLGEQMGEELRWFKSRFKPVIWKEVEP